MKLEWMGEYRDLVEKLIHYCNSYAQCYTIEQNFNTPVNFSFSQLQVLEYILENEERQENMAAVAARLGLLPSAFSKNVNRMTDKGLLEKYHTTDNKKNIIIKVSDLGREVYLQYAQYVYDHGFGQAFRLLEGVPREYIDLFAQVLAGTDRQENSGLPVPPSLVKMQNKGESTVHPKG